MQDRYWSLEAGGGIQASDHKRSSNALFDLAWQSEDGTVALRANNGKFLATKRSGHLYANAELNGNDSDAAKYYFYLMNRPVLVLRCEQGFVGPKSTASPKLECNKAVYETIRVERCERGEVRFKGDLTSSIYLICFITAKKGQEFCIVKLKTKFANLFQQRK